MIDLFHSLHMGVCCDTWRTKLLYLEHLVIIFEWEYAKNKK